MPTRPALHTGPFSKDRCSSGSASEGGRLLNPGRERCVSVPQVQVQVPLAGSRARAGAQTYTFQGPLLTPSRETQWESPRGTEKCHKHLVSLTVVAKSNYITFFITCMLFGCFVSSNINANPVYYFLTTGASWYRGKRNTGKRPPKHWLRRELSRWPKPW